MRMSNSIESTSTSAWAVVERVDLVNRELVLNVSGKSRVVDVPLDCDVLLHDEPVKLRLLQPADRVWVTWRRPGDMLAAAKIEVKFRKTQPSGAKH